MMLKRLLIVVLTVIILLDTGSCTLLRKPIDNKSGFSRQLKQVEAYIRESSWENAKTTLDQTNKTWKKIKPWLQVDIDHDYVNDIEKEFVKLSGYIDTNEKFDSLASILLIQDIWKNIGSF